MNIYDIIQRLVHSDEKTRNSAREFVRTNATANIKHAIIEGLIGQLHCPDEQQNSYVEQAIISLGRDAVHQVSVNLLTSQSVPMQLGLARILTEIGMRVAPQDGPDIFFGLLAAANTPRSEEVIKACMQGIVRMRWPEFSEDEVREAARHARMCLVRSDIDLVAAAFSVT